MNALYVNVLMNVSLQSHTEQVCFKEGRDRETERGGGHFTGNNEVRLLLSVCLFLTVLLSFSFRISFFQSLIISFFKLALFLSDFPPWYLSFCLFLAFFILLSSRWSFCIFSIFVLLSFLLYFLIYFSLLSLAFMYIFFPISFSVDLFCTSFFLLIFLVVNLCKSCPLVLSLSFFTCTFLLSFCITFSLS